jgi:hypothetical protein
MKSSFGPWSTAIGTGAPQQLNTFWKRRLAMLPALNQTASRTTRRMVLVVGFLAAIALALPTLKWVAHGNSAGSLVVVAEAGEPESVGKAAAPVTVEFLPRPTKDEERILKALATPIDVEFLDLPLEDALSFMNEYPNLPKLALYIDKPTLTDEGVALDQPVTLKLKGLRLESVLKLLLRPVQLTFVIEDDVLQITTQAKAGEKLITRTYPVRDLYQPGEEIPVRDPRKKDPAPKDAAPKKPEGDSAPSAEDGSRRPAATQVLKQSFGGGRGGGGGAENGDRAPRSRPDLIEAILTNIQPDTWEELSGPGSLTYVKEAGSLVIRQTREVHAEILQLLRDLREAKRLGQAAPGRTGAKDEK